MRILLDTCIISELRKPDLNSRLKESIDKVHEQDLFMSVITLGELVKGVSLLEDGRRKRELSLWIGGLEQLFSIRILTIDQETAHIWGEVTAKASKKGQAISACDGLVAAGAIRHGLHLLTLNVKDFESTGVMLIYV